MVWKCDCGCPCGTNETECKCKGACPCHELDDQSDTALIKLIVDNTRVEMEDIAHKNRNQLMHVIQQTNPKRIMKAAGKKLYRCGKRPCKLKQSPVSTISNSFIDEIARGIIPKVPKAKTTGSNKPRKSTATANNAGKKKITKPQKKRRKNVKTAAQLARCKT